MMKRYILLIIGLFSIIAHAQETQDVELDLFLSEAMLKEVSIEAKLIHSIDYTNDGFLLLSSSNQFYVLGIGYIESLFNPTVKKIESFTVTPEGKLHIVSGTDLCKIDTLGNFLKIYSLPNANMGIASGNNKIYLFDQANQKDKNDYSLYSFSENRTNKLVVMDTPVTAVYEYNANLFFFIRKQIILYE